MMRYRKVGRSGLQVSAVALGSWLTAGEAVDEAGFRPVLEAALEGGINHIDTADVYAKGEAERVLGRLLEPHVLGGKRRHLVIATKAAFPMTEGPGVKPDPNDRGLSRKHLHESIGDSLERLKLRYVDIFYAHAFDPHTPLEESARAMDDLVRRGLCLYWGVSNWSPKAISGVIKLCKLMGLHAPIVDQSRYHLLDRALEGPHFATLAEHGLGLAAYTPLAHGILSGKHLDAIQADSPRAATGRIARDQTPEVAKKVRALVDLARERGLDAATLALAWVLRRPETSCALMGATRPEQLQAGFRAVEVELDEATWARLDAIFPGPGVSISGGSVANSSPLAASGGAKG